MSNNVQQRLNEIGRLRELERTKLLDSPAEESFDRLTYLASKLLNAPVAFISLLEPHRQYFKSHIGLPDPLVEAREIPLSHSFCKYVVDSGKALIVEDARVNPLVMDNPAVAEMDVIAYLGIPLTTNDGWHLGSFCVIDRKPRVWTTDEIEIMETLASSVTSEIQLRLNFYEKERMVEQLKIRNENLNAFSHTVSHNLKNSVSAIMGWTDISTKYADRVTFEELIDTMDKIKELAINTNDIINALLLLAGIDRMGEVEMSALPMFDIVEDALTSLELQISSSHAMIILPEEFPQCVGYRDWVEEVWINYISNALKYGGDPPKIELGADILDNNCVRYWVKDNGVGITEEDQEALFKTFSRLPQTSNQEGHGLGLSIAKRIMDKLGGEVAVESTLNEGSIFSFTLPC
ncbi:MAG: hypothetical protein Phog2KO_24400 [Phototrophicaceae bacterium]